MTKNRAVAFRRIIAFGVDWLVILAWACLLFGIVMAFSSGEPSRPSGPWVSQTIGFLTMTLPVLMYFAVSESSARQATLGKRVLGLIVRFKQTTRATFGVALARNAVKLTPWEFGHLVANQAAFSGDPGIPAWVHGAMAVSFFVPAWWIGAMFYSGRTPYDRLASTEVIRKTREPA